MDKKRIYAYKVLEKTALRFWNENYTYHASTLTFTMLLAIVPAILVLVYFVTIFPLFSTIITTGENYIFVNFVPVAAVTVQKYFTSFIKQAQQLPTLSIVFLLFATVTLVHTVEETLNTIWKIPSRRYYYKIAYIIFHWLAYVFVPFIIGAGILLFSYIISLFNINHHLNLAFHSIYFIIFLSILMNAGIFSLIYILLPNIKVNFRVGIIGGFFAAILFEVLKVAFAFYVEQFPSYSLVYGAFAVLPIFLLWLYLFWCVFIFCAILTNTLQEGEV